MNFEEILGEGKRTARRKMVVAVSGLHCHGTWERAAWTSTVMELQRRKGRVAVLSRH